LDYDYEPFGRGSSRMAKQRVGENHKRPTDKKWFSNGRDSAGKAAIDLIESQEVMGVPFERS
jgi:hypothetical protein